MWVRVYVTSYLIGFKNLKSAIDMRLRATVKKSKGKMKNKKTVEIGVGAVNFSLTKSLTALFCAVFKAINKSIFLNKLNQTMRKSNETENLFILLFRNHKCLLKQVNKTQDK